MERPYVLVTDTAADLDDKYYKENNVGFVPIYYTIDKQTFKENPDPTTMKDFYKQIRDGAMPTTSMINIQDYLVFFEPYLKDGKDVLYLGFSSGLSGSVGCAGIAANELREKYPERKLYVVDTLCASMGQGLFVEYAVRKRDSGASIDEVYHWAEENKLNVNHLVAAYDLMHLHRGGRVSRTSALVGSLVGIKPMIYVDTSGHLIPVAKKRGRKASITALADWMERLLPPKTHLPAIGISHADCIEDARTLEGLVTSRFRVDKVITNYIGRVIGSHTGCSTLSLFFLGQIRKV